MASAAGIHFAEAELTINTISPALDGAVVEDRARVLFTGGDVTSAVCRRDRDARRQNHRRDARAEEARGRTAATNASETAAVDAVARGDVHDDKLRLGESKVEGEREVRRGRLSSLHFADLRSRRDGGEGSVEGCRTSEGLGDSVVF